MWKTKSKFSKAKYVKVIREPEFAKRFESACDAMPHCPPMHQGRLTWIKNELERRFGESVSVDADLLKRVDNFEKRL